MTKTIANTAQNDRGPEPNHLAKNKAKTRVEMLYCIRDLLRLASIRKNMNSKIVKPQRLEPP